MAERVRIPHDATARRSGGRVRVPRQIVEFTWPGSVFESWARGWVVRNFWRVQHLFLDKEDALQECALIFVRCCNTYRGRIDKPAWMMSVFKTAVHNDWNTFAQRDSRARSIPIPETAELVEHNPGLLVSAVAMSSADLRCFLDAIATAPAEFLSLLLHDIERTQSDNTDEAVTYLTNCNRRIKRLLGIKGSATDIVSELCGLLK